MIIFVCELPSASSYRLSHLEAYLLRAPPTCYRADMGVKYRAQKAQLRHSQTKKLLLILAGQALAVWVYLVAIQLLHPDWIYGPFAQWFPLRMDYVGEAAFFASFIAITAAEMWNAKRNVYRQRPETYKAP